MVLWLEEFLNSFRGVLIMVTHDRYFLDRVTNKIVEIDKGKLYEYDTNYSGFVELKVQREEMELATERKRQSLLRVEMEWMKLFKNSSNQKPYRYPSGWSAHQGSDHLWKWNPCILSSAESRIPEETKYFGICDGWKRTSGLEDRE